MPRRIESFGEFEPQMREFIRSSAREKREKYLAVLRVAEAAKDIPTGSICGECWQDTGSSVCKGCAIEGFKQALAAVEEGEA